MLRWALGRLGGVEVEVVREETGRGDGQSGSAAGNSIDLNFSGFGSRVELDRPDSKRIVEEGEGHGHGRHISRLRKE